MEYNKQNLQNIIDNSSSMKEIFEYLGFSHLSSSYTYKKFKKLIIEFDLDISRLKTKSKNNYSNFEKRDIEDYLSNKNPISSNNLKKRLLKENIFNPICSFCNNSIWNDKPIPLQLDHIDGNSSNNNLSNLRLLCPNCHAQTDTYCGKNISKKKEEKICPTCNSSFIGRKQYCSYKCINIPRISQKCFLSNEEIYKLFLENDSNYVKTSKLIGISDNAIRKRIKSFL